MANPSDHAQLAQLRRQAEGLLSRLIGPGPRAGKRHGISP
jgi:hypothetical protein